MDVAYDHITEQTYAGDRATTPTPPKTETSTTNSSGNTEVRPSLQSEFQETFKAFSSSPWGSRLGGLWGNVRKQGESYYEGARKEAEAASGEALKGFTDLKETLVSRTRGMSASEQPQTGPTPRSGENFEEMAVDNDASLRENDNFIARFKSEAAKRLKEIEKAEDAADEALLRFGTNIRNFLKDAVAVAPPEDQPTGKDGAANNTLFESKDASGKRVIHTSRLDAQLHVIHTTSTSFKEDPSGWGGEWVAYEKEFDVGKMTDAVSKDLEAYPDLRTAMERLVPETVDYRDFWCRYYFLRHVLVAQEEKRRELLKASSAKTPDEDIAWDEDSEDDDKGKDKSPSTPQIQEPPNAIQTPVVALTHAAPLASDSDTLKPEGRRSHDEKSVADSDASYDLVSGATSRAPGSPKDETTNFRPKASKVGTESKLNEESDEEDWE